MKQIELLLTESIDNLGIVGDVVKVRPGFARNFLLPRNMATKPTPGAIKRLAARRAEVEAEMKKQRSVLEAILEKLKGHELTMMRSANEQGVLFGGVSQHEIAEALRAEGFAVEDRMVRIGQQIKRLDSYQIPIALSGDLKTEVKVWIVSDKPTDKLETEREEEEAEEAAPASGGEEGEAKPKKKRGKRSEDKAEEAEASEKQEKKKPAAEAAPEEHAKPKRKGKKEKETAE